MRPIVLHLERQNLFEVTVSRPGELWTRTFQGWELVKIPELIMTYLTSLVVAIYVFNGIPLQSIVSIVLNRR
ncbi:hypothetical protein [Pseudomonas fragi]|uniref:hypothetical protein n=1 Tax=Pseudomonas fragi TaxID=296 RepID=UPI001475DC01|nr:hypothetical protein [Pseudomonas fragi]NNB29099.1 hypothetical protein [Pseudomonas fragi]